MKFILAIVVLSVSYTQAFAETTCGNVGTFAGKLGVYSNGQVTVNGTKLDTKPVPENSGVEVGTVTSQLKLNELSPTVTGVYEYYVKRNEKRQPVEVSSKVIGTMNSLMNPYIGSPTGLAQPFSPMTERFIFDYAKDGSCVVKRTLFNATVTFDRALCENLSDLFEKFSKSEIDRCNQIVSKMSSAVEDFKKSIKAEGLSMSESISKNSYQDAILQSSECTKALHGTANESKTISIPRAKEAKAAR